MSTEVQTHYRTCNICEAMCGLVIEHRDKEILSIKGDKDDPFSKGHICPKAVALQDFYVDEDRLKTPIKRTPDGWEEMSWEQAFSEVSSKLKSIQSEHGKSSVGVYLGNPNAHNLGTRSFCPTSSKHWEATTVLARHPPTSCHITLRRTTCLARGC